MNPNDSDQLIIRYLLGQLEEENRRLLEEQYFDDDHLFSRLVEIENRLILEYAAGNLSQEDRDRFEDHFLTSPTRRQKVESAKDAARRRQAVDNLP